MNMGREDWVFPEWADMNGNVYFLMPLIMIKRRKNRGRKDGRVGRREKKEGEKEGRNKKDQKIMKKEEKREKNRVPENSLRRWHLSRNLFGPQEASGAELSSRGAGAKTLELFKEQTREPWLSLMGLSLNEMDEMSLAWAISRPQVQIPRGAQQEDEAGWGGTWPSGVYPVSGRLAATCAHGLDIAWSSLCKREPEYRLWCEWCWLQM